MEEAQIQTAASQSPARTLSPLAHILLASFGKKHSLDHDRKITVNPVISKVASWYEKLRNAMEYREDEVILRATIERILKRRLLLGGNGGNVAEPLVRELLWGRYLPDHGVSEAMIARVSERIDIYLKFRESILNTHKISEKIMNEWTYQLMSADIENMLNPNNEKETIANFMFQVLHDHLEIRDDVEETKNAQVFVAVRMQFARDDVAFLRFHLFQQYFGKITPENLEQIVREFPTGYTEIMRQLHYPLKERINVYIRKRSAAFLILEDVLRVYEGNIEKLLANEEEFKNAVVNACSLRYQSIRSKVRVTIIRSVIFILTTKVLFAFLIEGTYDKFIYGSIQWVTLIINTAMPPLLMVIVGFFIFAPDASNTDRIYQYILQLLYDEHPRLGNKLSLKVKPDRTRPVLNGIFSILWLCAFLISFGTIVFILIKLHFNPVSILVFLFFLTIVSFLAYRISVISRRYTVGDKQGLITPIIDFLFMPVVRVGKELTSGISQINVVLVLFDLLIEAPFKVIFAFFEQWFSFLHNKSEELG